MELKDKDKLQKAAGMVVKHEKTEMEHEKEEDSKLKQIHKHVKHGLAMGDLDGAMESLEKIDEIIKSMTGMQKKVEKEEKKEEKKPEVKDEKKDEEKK